MRNVLPWVIAICSGILLKLYILFLKEKLKTLAEYNKIKQKEILDKQALIRQLKQVQNKDFDDKLKASQASKASSPDPRPTPQPEVSEDAEDSQPENLDDFKPYVRDSFTKEQEYNSENIINYPEDASITLFDIYNSSDFSDLVQRTNRILTLAEAKNNPDIEDEAINLVNHNLDLFRRCLPFMIDPKTSQPVNYFINKYNIPLLYSSFRKNVPMWFVETFESVLDEHIKDQPRPRKNEGVSSAGGNTSPPNRPQEAREQGQAYQTPQTDENATQSQHREQEAQGKPATSSPSLEAETDPRAEQDDRQEPPRASTEGTGKKEDATNTGERIKPNFGVPRTGTSSAKKGRGRPKNNAS